MKNKIVTLFGGGGFIGRYITGELLAAGARVRVAQRDPRQAYFLKVSGGVGQVAGVVADLRRPDTIARAVEGADAVVNLVGVFGGDLHAIHVAGAGHVAELARKAGASALVHVSAIGADAQAASAYARSKGQGEDAVRAGFPAATILRPSLVFGREDAFTNRFASLIAKAPVLPVLRAHTRFQPIYVADLATAAVRALADPERHGGKTYALGGPDVMTMGAIQRWLAATIGRTPPIVELPDAAGAMIARLGFLPGAPITWDQWLMLQHDNVVPAGEEGLAAFGIEGTPMAAVAPRWLVRYRRGGRFGARPEPA